MTSVPAPSPIRKLDSITFDEWLRQEDPFGRQASTFDLTGIELVTPCALVQLAAACHALAATGRSAVIVVDDDRVCTYLMRAGFIQAVESVARFEPEIVVPTAHSYDGVATTTARTRSGC